MKARVVLAAALGFSALVAAAAAGRADTVELKNGSKVEGKYIGGTATTVNVQTPQGVLAVPTADVVALKFGAAAPAAQAAAPAGAAPAAAAVPAAATAAPVTIPAGTVLTIRMDSPVSSKDKAGTKFTAKLVGDVMAGSVPAVKAGTTVQGKVDQSKQAGRLAGKSQLAISLSGIDLGGGQILPIVTSNFAEAGKGEFRKTARNVAGGALIGNAIDDDGGSGKGAAVGAGVSLIKKGDAVTVPPGALLEFRLTQPVTVPTR